MTNTEIGLIGLGALFILFVLRMPVEPETVTLPADNGHAAATERRALAS